MFKKFTIIFFCISSFLAYQSFAEKTITFTPQENGKFVFEEDYQSADMPPFRYQTAFFRMFLILGIIILLVIITFWMFRRIMKIRMHQINNSKSIKILEKRVLSPKSILYLVEVEKKKMLISESHLEVRSLQFLEPPSKS